MTVRIVTDSTADLPADLVERYGIAVVPLSILFGDEELRDGIDINSEQFFKRLARETTLPTTSQPSPALFRATYERLRVEGATEILSIHVSSKLSGTLQSALQGADGVGDVRFRHVDSGTVSLALGMAVLAAAAVIDEGGGLEAARAAAEDRLTRTHLFFVLDTLEYLRRGGRLSRGSEILGTLLKVKPLLAIENGELIAIGRVRTRQKAIEELLQRVSALRPITHCAAVHATTPDDLKYVVDRLDGIAPDASVLTARITPVLGVHAGPGVLGITVVTAGAPPVPTPPA
ncbi:MAG: DegV family protein [Dehalococcoidia bacterium]